MSNNFIWHAKPPYFKWARNTFLILYADTFVSLYGQDMCICGMLVWVMHIQLSVKAHKPRQNVWQGHQGSFCCPYDLKTFISSSVFILYYLCLFVVNGFFFYWNKEERRRRVRKKTLMSCHHDFIFRQLWTAKVRSDYWKKKYFRNDTFDDITSCSFYFWNLKKVMWQ